MDKQLYLYRGQVIPLSAEEVGRAVLNCETKLRTTKIQYINQQAFLEQAQDIKATWPEGLVNYTKAQATGYAGAGNAIGPSALRRAIIDASVKLSEVRAKHSSRKVDSELRYIAGEIAVATLFRRAPDATVKEPPLAKRYKDGGKLIRVRPTLTSKALIVNITEINTAEIFVFALFVEVMKSCFLLGYATREQLAKSKPEKSAFQIPLGELRPMSQFYAENGLTEIPGGIAMESIPDIRYLPIPQRELQDMTKGQSAAEFDFNASLGLPDSGEPAPMPKSAASSTVSPPAEPSIGDL